MDKSDLITESLETRKINKVLESSKRCSSNYVLPSTPKLSTGKKEKKTNQLKNKNELEVDTKSKNSNSTNSSSFFERISKISNRGNVKRRKPGETNSGESLKKPTRNTRDTGQTTDDPFKSKEQSKSKPKRRKIDSGASSAGSFDEQKATKSFGEQKVTTTKHSDLKLKYDTDSEHDSVIDNYSKRYPQNDYNSNLDDNGSAVEPRKVESLIDTDQLFSEYKTEKKHNVQNVVGKPGNNTIHDINVFKSIYPTKRLWEELNEKDPSNYISWADKRLNHTIQVSDYLVSKDCVSKSFYEKFPKSTRTPLPKLENLFRKNNTFLPVENVKDSPEDNIFISNFMKPDKYKKFPGRKSSFED